MKTDRVLTMEECLNEWGAAPMQVDPPACDVRHVPIAAEKDVHDGTKARNCTCDRWGHPCPTCVEPKAESALSFRLRHVPNN